MSRKELSMSVDVHQEAGGESTLILEGPVRRIIERKSPWIGVHPPCDAALLDVCGHCVCIPTDWDQDTIQCGECHFDQEQQRLREEFVRLHPGPTPVLAKPSSLRRRVSLIPAASAVLFWLGTLIGWLLGEVRAVNRLNPEMWVKKDDGPWVPLSVRNHSRIVTWLWTRTAIGYETARRLARWLP